MASSTVYTSALSADIALTSGGTSVPQSRPIPGSEKDMIRNDASGFVFKVDELTQLLRWLILGSDTGTFYRPGTSLTLDNLTLVRSLLATGQGLAVVKLVEDVFEKARAPRQDTTLMTLAVAARHGTATPSDMASREVRAAAWDVVRKLRTMTQVYSFLKYYQLAGSSGGWGALAKRAICDWFISHDARWLTYQSHKYGSREGWTAADILRLVHLNAGKFQTPMQLAVKAAASKRTDDLVRLPHGKIAEETYAQKYDREVAALEAKSGGDAVEFGEVKAYLDAISELKDMITEDETLLPRVIELVHLHRFTREFMQTWMLKHCVVHEALLLSPDGTKVTMPITALLRSLAVLTVKGVFGSYRVAKLVADHIQNREVLVRGHVHPVALLLAWATYKQGRGDKSSLTWDPHATIVAGLESAFRASYSTVAPTGKRIFHAFDGSGSMSCGIAGLPITAAQATAVMGLCFSAAEDPDTQKFAIFSSGRSNHTYDRSSGLTEFSFPPETTLDQTAQVTQKSDWGGTDCSLPIRTALDQFKASGGKKGLFDAFVIYTDNDTWAGTEHVCQSLKKYRDATKIPAKLVVVATRATSATVADPKDPLTFELVGFDAQAPKLLHDFLTGDMLELPVALTGSDAS